MFDVFCRGEIVAISTYSGYLANFPEFGQLARLTIPAQLRGVAHCRTFPAADYWKTPSIPSLDTGLETGH